MLAQYSQLTALMARYRNSEYSHLILAERAIAFALEAKPGPDGTTIYPDNKDIASLASALTRVVDQKRVMRGQPAPKPVEGRQSRGSRRPGRAAAPCHAEPSAPSTTMLPSAPAAQDTQPPTQPDTQPTQPAT